MTGTRESRLGGPLFVVGAVIMIVGLLGLIGTGEIDWVSLFFGIVGAVMSAAGLYLFSRRNGASRTRHAAS